MDFLFVSAGKLFLLLQVFGFQVINSHFLTYQCNSTSYSLLFGVKATDGTTCRDCLSSEAHLPICQRRLYAPVASCKPKSGRISFELKAWQTGSLQDNVETDLRPVPESALCSDIATLRVAACKDRKRSVNDQFGESLTFCLKITFDSQGSPSASFESDSPRSLTFQPSNHALVVDFNGVSFIQYLGFSFKWNSSSSNLQFTVDYSMDGHHWNDYVEDERVKVFQVHRSDPRQCLCRKVLARFLRIKLTNDSSIGSVIDGHLDASHCPTFGSLKSKKCEEDLGMESGAISDRQISASSEINYKHGASNGRLRFTKPDETDAWVTRTRDYNQWLQVDSGSSFTLLTAVATQGRGESAHLNWVTKYKLQYSDDGVNFQNYKEQGQTAAKEFDGNTDGNTVVYHRLNPPVRARYIRFQPLGWHVYIAMRVELYGCPGKLSFNNKMLSSEAILYNSSKSASERFPYNSSMSISASLNHTRLYLGCYMNAGMLDIVYSGLVGFTEIDETACIKRCSDLGYRYASIQSGLLCFCGNDIPSILAHDQNECLLPYLSDHTKHPVVMRYYRVPKANLTVETVSFSHKKRQVGAIYTIEASVNNHEMGLLKFTVYFGDGNELSFCDSPGTYFYKNPGNYSVLLTIEDLKGNRLSFNDDIEIADNLTKVVLECPPATPEGRMVQCTAKIARGLSVVGNIIVENKDIPLQQVPDSRMSRVGEDFPRHLPITPTMLDKLLGKSELTYVLADSKFQEEGYLSVLEFIVAQPGLIRIQILRKTDGEKRTQNDIPQNLIRCSDSQTFNLVPGTCCSSDVSCEQVDSDPGLLSVVSDIILGQHLCAGYHSVDFSNVTQVEVLPGDTLAWISSNRTGKIAILRETSNSASHVYEGVMDGEMKDSAGLQSAATSIKFALSAHFVPLSLSKVTFGLERIAVHPVLLTLRDEFDNEEIARAELVYQQEITGLTLNVPEFALVGEVTLELSITNGTNVTYIWHFGDSQITEIFIETSVTHNYNSSGSHSVSVIASNDVSVAQSECTGPYVLFAVGQLSIPFLEPVMVNQNVSILVDLAQGSLVDLNISLGDESTEFNLTEIDVKDHFVVAINHSYGAEGVFTVHAFAKNILSNTSALRAIVVQWPIVGLNVLVPQGVHSSHEDLVVNMSVAQGTNVTYNVKLNSTSMVNEELKTASGKFTNVVFPKDVLTCGLFTITVTALNLVSSNESSINVVIETPITEAVFRLTPSFPGAIEARASPKFHFYYRTGSNLTITVQKDLGEKIEPITPGKENKHWFITFFYPMYSDPGVYTAQANYSNVFGYVVLNTTVVVQEPVKDIEVVTDSFVPLPPGIVNIAVKQNGTLATNATVICSYGDGSTSPTLDFTEDFNISHRFSKAADYKIVVNVSNLVSFTSNVVNVTLELIPTFLIINTKSSADALSSESFSSLSGDKFPIEFAVIFEVQHDGDPNKDINFFFDFGDGFSLNSTSTSVSGEHTYTSTGEVTVTVTLKHRFGELTNSTKITIEESLAGLTIEDDAPTVVNEPTTFILNWDKQGRDTLIEVDFGDGEKVLFGENINIVDSSLLAIFKIVSYAQKNITFTHIYKEIRIYEVIVNGWNDVSSMTISHQTVNVEEECRYPDPVVLGVGADPQTARNVTNEEEIIIYAKIVIQCKASYETVFEWKVYHHSCDDSENTTTPIEVDTGLNKSTFTIPPYSLPNGVICLKFQAKMKYVLDVIESHTTGYLNVLPGRLKARIFGGNFRTASSQRPIVIDGSFSEDSNMKAGNLSEIQFRWFCRQMNELFPERVEDLPPVSLANPSGNSVNYGCEGSGPRMLSYSEPVWQISPGVLRNNQTYVVKMVITKDTREAMFEQTIQVLRGVAPEVAVGCDVNCDEKVNTQSPLSVTCSCMNCDQEGFTNISYGWELYAEGQRKGVWYTVPGLSEKAMTDIYMEHLVLRKYKLDNGRSYRLTCRATNKDGIEGRSEYHFVTNTPPQKGNCSIHPAEGKVLQTFFNVECSGWQDEDGYVSYKLYRDSQILQHGDEPVMTPTLLPLGYALRNYTYKLTVKVVDKYGSFSKAVTAVTVTESTLSADELPDLMTSKDGLLYNMIISGDTQGIAQLVSSVSSALDSLAAKEKLDQTGGTDNAGDGGSSTGNEGSDGGENNGADQFEDSEAKKNRMKMKENLLGALESLEHESLDTTGAVIEALASVTNNVEEVSTASQLSMLNILKNSVATLSEKKSADSLDVIESVGTGVMQNLGNLFGASKFQQDKNAHRMALLKEKKQNNDESQEDAQTSKNVAELQKEGKEMKENARNMTKTAMKVLDDVLGTLSVYLVAGQEPQVLKSERMSALIVKMHAEDLSGSNISIVGGSFVLPNMEKVSESWDDRHCYVLGKGLNTKDNPFIWDNSSSGVDSNCLGLRFENCHGNSVRVANLTEPIYITIPRQGAGEAPQPGNFNIEKKTMKVHKITIEDSSYSIHANVHPVAVNCSHKFRMFLRQDKYPTTEAYDFNWTMPVVPGVVDWNEGFSFSVSNLQLENYTSGSGIYYLGLYADIDDESQKDEKCAELNYTLFTFFSSCNFWDEEDEKWKGYGCEVAQETTFDSTVCRCSHLTNFGGGFFVAPNPIDFDAAFKGFTDIASNPVVFATVLAIFGLYFVGVIWARWRDKKDLEKVGVTPLLSNDPRDTYGYEITLQTGFQQKRRTTADVFIQLFGTLGDSEPRMLKDQKRAKFGRGEIDQFLLTVPQSLGSVKEIHIWHNNAGKSPSWYLFRVLIRDLQTDTKWWFVCDRWLAVEEGDGAVDRRLHLATKEDLTKFNILFVNATRKNLLDGHLWLSVFTRPPKSTFTRVQRLSCCLSLLLSTMLANLMFYQVGADDNSSGNQSIHIGPFIFSVQQIMIGVQSSFVVLPVNMIIVSIFRKLKPKDDKSKSKKYEEIEEETPHEAEAEEKEVELERDNKKTAFSWRTLISIFKRDDDSEHGEKKTNKRFLFPHWCIYIAYVLIVLSSLTCGLFCMLYGFTFGKEKSLKWLTSMFVSFFQSILVIQPFKVLLLAAFFALVIRDPNKEEDQEQENAPDPALNPDEELMTTDTDKDQPRFSSQNKPPDAKKLEAARKLRLKQCEMKAIIKEIITHFLVVCVVLIVAYGNHDNRAFTMSNEVKNVLVDGGPNKISFDVLNTRELFWNWAISSLIPSLFPSSTSQGYPYVGIIKSGQTSNVLGIGRIRQIRITKDTCLVPEGLSSYIQECNDFYSWSEEERNDFSEGWSYLPQANDTESKVTGKELFTSPWHYQSVMEASSFPYMGKMASYRGGGFIVQLGPDKVTAINELEDLEASGWIDRYTRALFTELSIYNVNVNLLCVVTLLYEELPTGGGLTFVNVQTIRVYRYLGNFSTALMACEVVFAFLLLRWILRDGKRLWKERKAFCTNVWNIVDISITTLTLSTTVMYFTRLVFLNSATNKVRENRSKFVSFQYVVLLNEGVNIIIALVVLLLNLKFLCMLRFNRKISVLSSTMKASASKLASFMVMFIVIFLAYCFLVLMVFGPVLEDYRSIVRCMVSMMAMVLGNFEFYELVDVNPIIGPTVFFTFMVVFQFIIINMFIGILCDSFNEVRTDAVKQSNDYEILQFMTNRVKALLGLFVEPLIRPEYSWPKSELEKKVQTIEEKADTTMFFMRNLCAEDVRQMRWFEEETWSTKKSMVMSLVLNTDTKIMENDLCDGVEAMNKIIEKYSENDLRRMIVASRMRRQSSLTGASSVVTLADEDDEDSETEDQDSDGDGVETKGDETNGSAEQSECEDPEKKNVEEEDELLEQIEDEFEENEEEEEEQEEDAEKYDDVEQKERVHLERPRSSRKSHNNPNNNTNNNNNNKSSASLRGVAVSPSMPESWKWRRMERHRSQLGNNENNGFLQEMDNGFAKAATPTPSNLLSVEVPDIPTLPVPVREGRVEDCTKILIEEADDDRISPRPHSEA